MTILLVRPRLIGDVILTTPAVRALRRRFPDAEILYLVEALAAPVIAANPHVTEVITVEYRRGWQRLRDDARLGVRLRRRHIDLAIDFHGGPRSGWLTWASGATVRVGYDVAGRGWMYTRLVPRGSGSPPRHSVLNQWDLLAAADEALAAERPTPDRDRVEMPAVPEAAATLAARLDAAGVAPGARVIVMHVSARNAFRRWPESSFASLAAGLVADDGARTIVVFGGPSDRDAASRVIAQARALAPAAEDRIVPGEGWSLPELRAMMDRAALFVGGDSGPLHVAATSDVPIVALYGPTLADVWAPWRPASVPFAPVDGGPLPCRPCPQRACVPGDFRCLGAITPVMVRAAAERLLETR